jgi:hypothetical protein
MDTSRMTLLAAISVRELHNTNGRYRQDVVMEREVKGCSKEGVPRPVDGDVRLILVCVWEDKPER